MDNPNTDEFQQMYYSWCIDTKQVNIVDSDSISDNYEYSKDSNRSTRYSFTYASKALGNYLEITDNESGITKRVDGSVLNTFEEGMEIEREVKLSDIADSVEYIRLETTDDCLVKGFKLTNIIKTTKYYIIPEAQKVFQFTLDGKFVRNIGRRGQGPGEFLYVTHIDANEKSNLISIYCSSSQKMNFYNLETGKFIYSVRSPYQDTSITSMYNDSTFISHVRNINGQKEIKLYFSDKKGKMLKSFNRPEKFICPIAGASISSYSDNYIYRYENEVCYKEYENDTIYVATPDITLRVNRAAGIGLGWDKIPGATGYAIYRKPYDGNSDWVRVTTITICSQCAKIS